MIHGDSNFSDTLHHAKKLEGISWKNALAAAGPGVAAQGDAQPAARLPVGQGRRGSPGAPYGTSPRGISVTAQSSIGDKSSDDK